jgi:peptidyl-prolyl cis-trans isomerase SurA
VTRLACLLLALVAGPVLGAELIDGVAAVVGTKVILRSELDFAAELLARRAQQETGTLDAEQYRELRMQALRSLIDDRIMMQAAEQMQLAASEEEIDAAIAGIAKEENLDPDEIYAAARSQGLDRETYRRQLAIQMTRMRVITSSVRQRITINEEEVKELYEQRYAKAAAGERIRVLHILVPLAPDSTPEQQAELEALAHRIREQALETGDYAGLARRYSAAPSASSGGLTIFRAGDAPPLIEQALTGLAPGEISPVLRTEHGFNLFQFLDRFDPSAVEYEAVKDQLHAELLETKTLPEFEKWLDEVRKMRHVEIVNPQPR